MQLQHEHAQDGWVFSSVHELYICLRDPAGVCSCLVVAIVVEVALRVEGPLAGKGAKPVDE
jgi:hypothetical protein